MRVGVGWGRIFTFTNSLRFGIYFCFYLAVVL